MPMQEKAPRPESRDGFEFTPWPKTARLFRDIVITEKLDGTNAGIHVRRMEDWETSIDYPMEACTAVVGDARYVLAAQSRNRLITPEHDNYAFARWVHDNAADLAYILGPGLHFGEWWGQGIARKYGMDRRVFSVFNTARWFAVDEDKTSMYSRAQQSDICDQIDVVPVLDEGIFSEERIRGALEELRRGGSFAAPGFMNPEGICIYHTQTRQVMKVTLDANDAGKWEAA
ncbi:RNA ligase family protein [Streptomyces sp. NPDC056508]|uniref:RNA ligase family protein n=1 Tax=Streptomyces sp. NPDC056508 TaxID=3345845 RepID=UPI00369BA6EF